MKVICTQENLKNGLASVSRIVSPSNSLPILNNILIKTENGLLKLSSTNLEIAITCHIRCKAEQEGEVSVSAKTLTDLVSNLPNQNIELVSEPGGVKIETENYHTVIKTLPAEDFPLIPTVESSHVIQIDSLELKNSLDQVGFAVSTNQTQPEISGVLLSFEGKVLKIVATDRYRLAEKKLILPKIFPSETQIIIPHKTVMELSRVIGSQKGMVEAVFSETQIAFKFNDTEIVSRLVDGQYPDYKQIIPSKFSTEIITKKQELLSALKTTGIFSQTANSVKFDYSSDTQVLKLLTESQELGKSEVGLASKISGPAGTVVLNYRYVLDCLGSVKTENVVIKITDDNSPSLLLPEKQDDYLYLVMPIKS